MDSIKLQTIFYEYQNKNRKINLKIFDFDIRLKAVYNTINICILINDYITRQGMLFSLLLSNVRWGEYSRKYSPILTLCVISNVT